MPAATPLVIFGVVFLMFVINVRAGAVVRVGGALLSGAVAALVMTTALNWYTGTIRDSLPSMQPAKARLSADDARYAAQRVFAVIDGNARTAAFMDQALRDDAIWQRLFERDLKGAISSAPIDEPEFARFGVCVDAARSLYRFAELRRAAGRQNDQSDEYRRPFWDAHAACKNAVS